MGLVETVKNESDVGNRSFGAVMFRRIAGKTRKGAGEEGESEDLFWSLQDPQKSAIRATLLECMAAEQEPAVRNKVGDAVAEVARQYTAVGMRHCVRIRMADNVLIVA